MSVIFKKVCTIGDFGVGKTSLIRRFLDRQFSDHYLSTIGVKISRKLVSVATKAGKSQEIQLIIWDLEGETQFHEISPKYLQGSAGAIVVADLNRPETISRLEKHIEIVRAANSEDVVCVVALNKADIFKSDCLVSPLKIASALEAYPQVVKILPTSAKTGEQVETMFEALAQSLLRNHLAKKELQAEQ